MVTSLAKHQTPTVWLISFSPPRSPCDAGAAPVCVHSFRPPRTRNPTHPYSSLSLQWAGFVRTAEQCRQVSVAYARFTTAGWFLFKKRCTPKEGRSSINILANEWRRTFRVPMRMSCGGLSVMRLRSASSGLLTWSRFCNSRRAFTHVKPPCWRHPPPPPKCSSV